VTVRAFPNLRPERLRLELEDARSVGAKSTGATGDDFRELFEAASEVWLYAISEGREIRFCAKTLKGVDIRHSVLFEGRPVQAAGEIMMAGTVDEPLVLGLNRCSGHYQPDEASLDLVIEVLASCDITVPDGVMVLSAGED
jgi:hypothetical protein